VQDLSTSGIPWNEKIEAQEVKNVLLRNGIKVKSDQYNGNLELIIANYNINLNRLLTQTQWGNNWKLMLQRIKGAKKLNTSRFGDDRQRAVSMRLSNVLTDDATDDETIS
jgi:hypothetical protein